MMNKKNFKTRLLFFLMLLLLAVLSPTLLVAQDEEKMEPVKIAYIDHSELRTNYTAFQEANMLNFENWKKEVEEFEAEKEKIYQNNGAGGEGQKKETDEKIAELEKAHNDKLSELEKEREAKTQSLETAIGIAIGEVVEAGKYVELRTLFEGTQACDGEEITQNVLNKLN